MNPASLFPLFARVLCSVSLGMVLSVHTANAQHKLAADKPPASTLEEEASAALTGGSPEVRRLAEQAADKYKEHDYAGAIAVLDRLIGIAPQLFGAYNARGFARLHTHDLAGAEADFKHAVALAPKASQGYLGLGNVKRERGDVAGAATEYHQAIQLDPRGAAAYIGLGNIESDKKNYPQAEADYTHAIAAVPSSAAAWRARCAARLAQHRTADARADVDHALKLEPNSARAYGLRSIIKHDEDDPAGAVADCRRVLALDPKAFTTLRELAYIEAEQRRYDAALADVERSLSSPSDSTNSLDYAQFLTWSLRTRLGRSTDADQQLAAYLSSRPHNAAGEWPGHVGAFLLGRETEEALFAHAKAGDPKRIDGQRCEAWYYAGLKKQMAGDKPAAAEHYRQCVATGQKTYYEFRLAQAELRSL